MFCPTCHEANSVGAETCNACDARLPDRQRVYVGQQFILLNADADHPIAVRLDDSSPVTVAQPTIVSRHRHAVGFGDAWGDANRRRRSPGQRPPVYYHPLPDQPRLEAPQLDLTAVLTERRVYRPDDEAHIFIVAPDYPNGEVDLEVRLADQQIMREKVTLNTGGLGLFPYADLEEGEYTVYVQRSGERERAECRFSVVEFGLSPLVATLESHTYARGTLRFQLRVQQLSVPYTGKVTVGLECAKCSGRVVQTQKLKVRQGVVASEFDLSDHDGPFKLQITTPQGETALVDLPGSGAKEREQIIINPLGHVAQASLLPGDDTEAVRGLHISYGDVNTAPLGLESAVAPEARFTAGRSLSAVQIVTHNPLSGESALHEWRDVRRGERLTVEVNSPFTLFTVASATPDGLHESWATVIRPLDLEGSLSAPDQAAPGDQITLTLKASPGPRLPSTVHCLLLVYDARLEHESPLPKLGRRQYQAIRDASGKLGDGPAPDATKLYPPDLLRSFAMATGLPRDMPKAAVAMAGARLSIPAGQAGRAQQLESAGTRPLVPTGEAVEAAELLIPPTREDFPELAYLELFEFEGQAERVIPLGDQIGTWRCRAYLVSGLDLAELTANVQAEKPLYAELDLPAIVAEGDEIEASVTYHSAGPAEMSVTLPDGEIIRGMVMGHGTERFKLTGPGEVSVQLGGQAGQDWTTRTVKAPGVQTVTASRLELLRAGETVTGQRVMVYPGMDMVLTDTIEALLRYPFG
jgi:hypothetical protein